MTEQQQPTDGSPQEALTEVLRWLGTDPAQQDPTRWEVRPFRDAWWVAPRPRQRGDSAYLVRRGTVAPVPSNGQVRAADVHEELVTRQG